MSQILGKSTLDALRAKRAEERDGGFTLIELLVVVVIIGILVAIAIPLYLNYRQGANNKAAQSDVRGAVAAVEQCYTNAGNAYPATAGGGGTAGNALTFTCGTGAGQTAPASNGDTMSYQLSTDKQSYQIKGDNGVKSYIYNSTTGKIVEGATGAAFS